MPTILRTEGFDAWLRELADSRGKAAIAARIVRAQAGNFGDVKQVGEGVSEMRVDVGPGYRVYFMRDGHSVYVLLAGGDKSTQAQDIKRAIALGNELRGEKRAAAKPKGKK